MISKIKHFTRFFTWETYLSLSCFFLYMGFMYGLTMITYHVWIAYGFLAIQVLTVSFIIIKERKKMKLIHAWMEEMRILNKSFSEGTIDNGEYLKRCEEARKRKDEKN